MKEKVVNKLMYYIKKNNNFSSVKLEEIRYGLYGVYSLTTKTLVILLIAILLHFTKDFLLFLLFYGILRGVSYGTHAKSNLMCWIFSTIFLIGIPYLFITLNLNLKYIIILWIICFINTIIFSPADTDKRPMINKLRKLKFKICSIIVCLLYLFLIFKFSFLRNYIISGMILESLLINPLGYIIMGQKVRFKLSDIYLFKQN